MHRRPPAATTAAAQQTSELAVRLVANVRVFNRQTMPTQCSRTKQPVSGCSICSRSIAPLAASACVTAACMLEMVSVSQLRLGSHLLAPSFSQRLLTALLRLVLCSTPAALAIAASCSLSAHRGLRCTGNADTCSKPHGHAALSSLQELELDRETRLSKSKRELEASSRVRLSNLQAQCMK